jgi:penicillin-binding protein 1A
MGQGASMALPIWARYMKKVYADKSLGYSPKEKFNVPKGFNSCGKMKNDSITEKGIDEIFQ